MSPPKPIPYLNASDGEETDQFVDAPINVLMEILRCPKFIEWNLRSLSLCDDLKKYICLHMWHSDMKGETCDGPRYEISGGIPILNNGNFDYMKCPIGTYQPNNFISIGSIGCEYLKSPCSDFGSIVSIYGSSSVDTTCRCDYSKGFAPVGLLYDIYNCKPEEEDCSCYLVQCLPGQILSAEYKCISIKDVLTAVGSTQGVTDTTYTDPFETTFYIASDNNDQEYKCISIEDVLTAIGQGVTDTTYANPFETTFYIASDNNDQGALGWVPKILIFTTLGGLLSYGVYLVIKKCRQQLILKDVDEGRIKSDRMKVHRY